MRIRPRSSCWATAVLLFTGFTAGNAYDYKPPEIPPAGHAAKFAQHDTHKGEGVTVAVDPYGPEKDSVFHVKFADHRILPVRLIISNDSDDPLSLADAKIQFTTSHKAKGEPLTKEDIERAVGRLSQASGNARDLVALKASLQQIPKLKAELQKLLDRVAFGTNRANEPGEVERLAQRLQNEIHEMPALAEKLSKALLDDPPLALKEGGIFRDGYYAPKS